MLDSLSGGISVRGRINRRRSERCRCLSHYFVRFPVHTFFRPGHESKYCRRRCDGDRRNVIPSLQSYFFVRRLAGLIVIKQKAVACKQYINDTILRNAAFSVSFLLRLLPPLLSLILRAEWKATG